MDAPVGEVGGESREYDPIEALQVLHAWAGGVDTLCLDAAEELNMTESR